MANERIKYTKGSMMGDPGTDLFTTISGPDLIAVMYMPGVGVRVLGELATITYSNHVDAFPVVACGGKGVRGITKGPRTIAGTMIFIQFDKHVLLDIIDYGQTAKRKYEAYASFWENQQGKWGELQGKLDTLLARQSYLEGLAVVRKGHGGPITYWEEEYAKNMYQLQYGHSKYNTVITDTELKNINTEAEWWRQRLQDLGSAKSNPDDEAKWRTFKDRLLPDILPPFNVILLGASESGGVVKAGIYGIEVVGESTTMSVEDLITEYVVTYMAKDYDPLDSIDHDPRKFQLGTYTLAQEIESIETKIGQRLELLNSYFVSDVAQAKPTYNYMLKFIGGAGATYDIGLDKMYVTFPAQTPNNPYWIIDGYYIRINSGYGMCSFSSEVSGKSDCLAEDEWKRGKNVEGGNCVFVQQTVVPDLGKEASGGSYTVEINEGLTELGSRLFDKITDPVAARSQIYTLAVWAVGHTEEVGNTLIPIELLGVPFSSNIVTTTVRKNW